MTLQIDITDSLLQTAADAPAELLWACPVELRKPVLRILDTLSSRGSDVDVALAGGPIALVAWLGLAFLVGRRCLRALRRGPVWLAGLAAGRGAVRD